MKLYDNVPQAIREGIFCLMTGTLVFATNSITAEASDGEPADESGNDNTSESVDVNSVEKQAADLIDYSDAEPISPQPEVTKTETPSADVTTTTSTYQETVSNNEVISVGDNVVVIEDNEASEPKVVATATTQETVEETVTKNLTKDTENVTVVQDGNTVTTTGEFVEDIKTTVTKSSTTVVTDDENIAKEIQKQIENEKNNNTESSGVEFGSLTEKYYVTDKNGKRTYIDNKLVDGATSLILETKDGESDPAIIVNKDDKEDPLSNVPANIKNALVNSSSIEIASRFEDATTFTLGGKTLSQAQIDILSENSISEDTTFIIAPAADGKSGFDVTYVDENGQYITVSDPLKQLILDRMDKNVTPESLRYKPEKEYTNSNSQDLQTEMENARAQGYALVYANYGSGTHEEKTIGDIVYSKYEDALAAMQELNDKGIYSNVEIVTHPLPEEKTTKVIKTFDGYDVTTKTEYERICTLDEVEYKGKMVRREIQDDGTIIYYKVNKTQETFTVLATIGCDTGHQETSFIVNGIHYYYDEHTSLRSENNYGINTKVYVDEMNSILGTKQTADNTLDYYTGGVRPEKKKLLISEGGTYFVDGTIGDTFICLTTDQEVKIILKGTDTILPIVTTRTDYQPIQTGNKALLNAAIIPNITFVTKAATLRTQGSNEVGNILAPNTKVTLGGGNFCGTIICHEIAGSAEGHWSPIGLMGYYVDSEIVGAEDKDYYTINTLRNAPNYVVSGIKTVNVELDKGTKSIEFKRRLVTLGSTYEVTFSRYSKESTRGVWTEVKTVDIPPTPPEIVVVPPTPPTPPVIVEVPPTDPPVETNVIVNNEAPTAQAPQVLGAKRNMPQVLGARRAKTGDMAQNPLVASMIIFGASTIALGALASLRKRR